MAIFSLLIAFGSALGLIWITLETADGDLRMYVNIGIWVLVGALVGARAAYVSVNWMYFQEHFGEIFQIWLGGLSWPGALAGGFLAVVVGSWIMGVPFYYFGDDLLPLLATLSIAAWLGCWAVGCAYGPETNIGLPAQDEWGIWRRRLPVQLLGAILTVILFWMIDYFRHHRWGMIPGLAASLGLGGLSLIMLGASALRADPYPLYNGIRLETWAALIFLGLSVLVGILAIFVDRHH